MILFIITNRYIIVKTNSPIIIGLKNSPILISFFNTKNISIIMNNFRVNVNPINKYKGFASIAPIESPYKVVSSSNNNNITILT